MSVKYLYHISVIFMISTVVAVSTQNVTISVPLNKTTDTSNKELFGDFVNLNASSTLEVGFVNVSKSITFIIFQVHSHMYNVTVYNNTLIRSSSVYGTNVGMYSSVQPALDKFFVSNQNAVNIKLYLSVHGYGVNDPIPGGCNMEFQPPISPYLQKSYTSDYVLIEAAPARDSADLTCTAINDVGVVFYLMYLPERKFDADTYFNGIQNMLTLDNIKENGQIIPQTSWRMRRMLSAYPGTGSIYVAVAFSSKNASAYSVYAPSYTYACSPMEEGGCDLLGDSLSKLLCASLLFFGLFVCYFGHRFFKTEMFLIGLITGVIITYILISVIAELERPALLGAAILSGVCFGAIWLLFWWFYGIPVFAVLLSTMNLGFLFAALIYFGLPGGLTAMQIDYNFWTLFILVMSLTSLILLSMTFLSNILCCAILGAYATIYPIDFYVGSNLKYIIINTVRRAVVPKFNSAVLSPPFEWSGDSLSKLLCASLLFFGLFVCYFGHRFFKTEMFLIGLITGVIITYILISVIAELERPALLGAAILSGVCFGAIWLLFWWFYGIPVFAVLLSTMNLGFLFAALIYFGLPGGLTAMQIDYNFWTLFILVMSLTSLILLSMTFLSNILCCAILGAYATIYPIDFYVGSNLKYIIINTVRRAVVPKFNSAVLSPPFEWSDTLVTLLWLALTLTGFLFQHYQNRGRPPFPPPPRSVRPSVPTYGTDGRRYVLPAQRQPVPSLASYNENTPLLF